MAINNNNKTAAASPIVENEVTPLIPKLSGRRIHVRGDEPSRRPRFFLTLRSCCFVMTHDSVQEEAADGSDDEEFLFFYSFFPPVYSTCTQRALAIDGQWATPPFFGCRPNDFFCCCCCCCCLQPFAHRERRFLVASVPSIGQTIWLWCTKRTPPIKYQHAPPDGGTRSLLPWKIHSGGGAAEFSKRGSFEPSAGDRCGRSAGGPSSPICSMISLATYY
ncbi:hypothetical protein CDAR_586371 [Caerostris darwini]|uniref:Cysteine-rich transmembrane CYSTM domain-containing protein n=1 Tax=Caerostris darwini TaxID=1538125 RepID=A0AAV4Q863_9ARAC|nr:hypothetical protein CDAR_586371 [Caerostris darwini]